MCSLQKALILAYCLVARKTPKQVEQVPPCGISKFKFSRVVESVRSGPARHSTNFCDSLNNCGEISIFIFLNGGRPPSCICFTLALDHSQIV